MPADDKPVKIHFSGFAEQEKAALKERAIGAGMVPVASVSKSLDYFVAGPTCDPKTREQAIRLGIPDLDRRGFEALATDRAREKSGPAGRSPLLIVGQRLSMPPGVYAALAVETADRHRDSACAVALVRIENGMVASQAHSLIRPPRKTDEFAHIHGLTYDALAGERPFAAVWASMRGLLAGADCLIAHNAPRNKAVLAACCEAAGVKPPSAPFACTLRGARNAVTGADGRSLSDMCDVYGVPLNRHEALSDAQAAALLFSKLHDAGVSLDAFRIPGIQPSDPDGVPIIDAPTNAKIGEFLGIAKGMVRDGVLSEEEMACVLEWMEDNAGLERSPHFSPLFEMAWRIVEDDVMTDEELEAMRATLEKWIAAAGARSLK